MINKRRFLGIPLARRRTRRWLVIGYWAVALTLVGIALLLIGNRDAYSSPYPWYLFLLIWTLAGILGGTRKGGLVRLFQDHNPKGGAAADRSFMTTGDIAAKEREEREARLDERDVSLRNSIHYKAYEFMRGNAFFLVPLLVLTDPESHLGRLAFLRQPLVCLFLLIFLGLPQSLILWTEPDMEEEK